MVSRMFDSLMEVVTNKVSDGRAIFIVAVMLQVVVFKQRLDNCAPGEHCDKFTLNLSRIRV